MYDRLAILLSTAFLLIHIMLVSPIRSQHTEHLVKDCTKRKNYHNKGSILVECVNKDLLHVDEHVSDTESINSIISY